ncbi:hypothetical protein L484_012450 [Morus notabilis]|uniref:Uncharacterized protein n=1 Tax=Morus notabilis TaxID=981085 RepID=W9R0Q0_9ROSA|nr:hypothetical protein L484_012450 [Morus notabilis]
MNDISVFFHTNFTATAQAPLPPPPPTTKRVSPVETPLSNAKSDSITPALVSLSLPRRPQSDFSPNELMPNHQRLFLLRRRRPLQRTPQVRDLRMRRSLVSLFSPRRSTPSISQIKRTPAGLPRDLCRRNSGLAQAMSASSNPTSPLQGGTNPAGKGFSSAAVVSDVRG